MSIDLTPRIIEHELGFDTASAEAGPPDPAKKQSIQNWPEPLPQEAYYGLAGEVVSTIEPHTEADTVAILVQLLIAFGSAIGRGPYYQVEGDIHATNEFALLVGKTSKGRKGISWGRVRQIHELIDDTWVRKRILSGLSSGEGLIWAVRDEVVRERNGKEEVVVDGVDDKRLLVVQTEFASTLRVMARDGNTLSPTVRQAWDTGDLRTMTKNSPAMATGALISIIGHVTADELRHYLDRTEVGNGFANRFLHICVRRSKCLPEGGQLKPDDLAPYARRIDKALEFARSVDCVDMDDEARTIWREVYPQLSEGLPGLLGAVISRAEAHVVRLAMLYALLDHSAQIQAPHLRAALALWEYAEASARYVFGDALGNPMADDILRALRVTSQGLNRTDISNLFKRHKDSQAIGGALDLLVREGYAHSHQEQTAGRAVEVWRAT